jgi:hypothetical protein
MTFKQYFTKIYGEYLMGNASHTNENLTVHFKVKDFNAWRTSYNGHEKNRVSAGITNGRVFRSADDQNDVVIIQDVADVAQARAWLGSDDLKAEMQKSGVLGSPSIRFAAAA